MSGYRSDFFRSALFAAAVCCSGSVWSQPTTPASEYRVGCDKVCLEQFADRYLDAVANRMPSRVPLSPDVRFTENGTVLAIGDALWATADALGANQLVFTDPASGGIHYHRRQDSPGRGDGIQRALQDASWLARRLSGIAPR